jgi:phospholipid:diacylglycerol acyltransferase
MSVLRRRPRGEPSLNDDTVDSSSQNTPGDETPDGDEHVLVPKKHLHHLQTKPKHTKGAKRRTAWIFVLGGLFGLIVAGFFANRNELLDLAALGEIDFQPLMDVLPAGFLREAKEFQV